MSVTRESHPELWACGTYRSYRDNLCRCERCKAAWKDYRRDQRAKMIEGGTFTHGRRSGYDAGCRCDTCRAARLRIARREKYEKYVKQK